MGHAGYKMIDKHLEEGRETKDILGSPPRASPKPC